YVEYENISDADKTIKEVEGHDVAADNAPPNSILKQVHNHELEFKLILSRDFHGWNFAVNPLATKGLPQNKIYHLKITDSCEVGWSSSIEGSVHVVAGSVPSSGD